MFLNTSGPCGSGVPSWSSSTASRRVTGGSTTGDCTLATASPAGAGGSPPQAAAPVASAMAANETSEVRACMTSSLDNPLSRGSGNFSAGQGVMRATPVARAPFEEWLNTVVCRPVSLR